MGFADVLPLEGAVIGDEQDDDANDPAGAVSTHAVYTAAWHKGTRTDRLQLCRPLLRRRMIRCARGRCRRSVRRYESLRRVHAYTSPQACAGC